MPWFSTWSRGRRAVAAATAIAVVAGVPITFGVLYRGFPVSDVELDARQVWVTNGPDLLAGRLNRQIEELDASVKSGTPTIDVVQQGDDAFLIDGTQSSLERIDAAFTTLVQRAPLPEGAEVSLGDSTISVLDPAKGHLWVVDVTDELSFDPTAVDPDLKLGENAHAVVSTGGTTFAISAEEDRLYTIDAPGAGPTVRDLQIPDESQLSAVGERAVVLDEAAATLIVDDGRRVELGERGIRIQQPGAEHPNALVAGETGLIEVPLAGGEPEPIPADITAQDAAAAPVRLDGCAHGAWGDTQRYLQACDGGAADPQTIEQPTKGNRLEFRVNRSVIALNNLDTGDVWLVKDTLRLVENWDEVTPPQEQESEEESDEKSTVQSFEDTLAERTEVNRPPIAKPDQFGVRPGRTTILPVLDNDTDPDGDVLVIPEFTQIPEDIGRLDVIDGGRALQFTAGVATTGTASFRYTVDDGREGGTAETTGDIRVVPLDQNAAPVQIRKAAISVEVGQSVEYNVLRDIQDPDGDEVFLDSGAPTSADTVRTAPDGTLTFTHSSGELGFKTVTFAVSDGQVTAAGELTVEVKPTGSITPIGTPDFAETFAGDAVVIEPLANDVSPNGAALELLGVDQVPGGASVDPNLERRTITVRSETAGAVYFRYALKAGAATSVGLVRVEVKPPPTDDPPPVAVKDVAFLRPGEPTTVKVLDNDVSPSGLVLAVQTVDTEAAPDDVTVEVLGNTTIRVNSSAALTEQTQFTYTVSDGESIALAGVTVVPVPPIVKRQPPLALDDRVTVREGDVVTADVLANDTHPDQAQLLLDPELVETEGLGAGIAFASDDRIRFQAPREPGEYSAVYRVQDRFGESATARVVFVVKADDAESNAPPVPSPQVARVFSGSRVRIDVPLDRIDPDGDSVALVGYTVAPELGRIVESAADHFVYEAYRDATGTDTFRYAVADTYGAREVGEVSVGVIPRSENAAPPNAVDDTIEVRPGKIVSVEVLANDSDPNGYPIALVEELASVDEGIAAEVDDDKILIEAGEEEGGFTVRYQIDNGQGGVDFAFVSVKVTKSAVTRFPDAQDYIVPVDDTVGQDSVRVDLTDSIGNPNGRDRDLVVSTTGPNADRGTVTQSSQSITVSPGDRRFAVAYTVTDPEDETLSATAFVIVPAAVGQGYAPPPYLDPDLPPQVMDQGATQEWDLEDIIIVPSGNDPLLVKRADVEANVATEEPIGADDDTLRFTPPPEFRGQATLVFEVTDGDTPDDPTGATALISLPVTVGDPEQKDVAPTFTALELQIEAGETSPPVDLRASTAHPNRGVIGEFEYRGVSGQTPDIQVSLSGSQLAVSAPRGVQPGATTTVTFEIAYRDFVVPGEVRVTVVPSTKPRAQAVTDEAKGQRSKQSSLNVLANDFNPFAQSGEPLRLVSARVENTGETSARVTSSAGGEVTVDPDASFVGVVSIVYTVDDATGDQSRQVQGRFLLNVRDRPDQVSPAPSIVSEGDRQAAVSWTTPATNGEPILDYTVSWTGPSSGSETVGPNTASYTAGGLENGGRYSFRVTARNILGDSDPSAASATAIPFGTPFPPGAPSLDASTTGNGRLTMNWGQANGNGRDISTYTWTVREGGRQVAQGSTPGTVRSATADVRVGGTYTFSVTATGPTGLTSAPSPNSNQAQPTPGEPQNPTATKGADGDRNVRMTWGDAPANGVDTVVYEIRCDGCSGSTGWRPANSGDTYQGDFGQATSFEVRRVVDGLAGPAARSNTVTPKDVDPPNPSGRISKGPSRACDTGGGGCAEVRITWENMPPGDYRVYTLTNGTACCSFSQVINVAANGQFQVQNHLGTRPAGETIAVRFDRQGAGPSFTLGGISGGTWNGLPYNGW